MNHLKVKVTAKEFEAVDIQSLELTSVDGSPLPPFSAGAHIDLHLGNSLVRQYSLCNSSAETHRYKIAVLQDANSRGGSTWVHKRIMVGDLLTISEPKNHFPLIHAEEVLLLAGGIGITPILCMAERLKTVGSRFSLHYCTRSVERTAFYERIINSGLAGHASFYFDTDPPEARLNLRSVLSEVPPGTHLYVCGPTGFIDFVCNTAKELGWGSDRLHFEYFGGMPPNTKGDKSFVVKIASSGKSFEIPSDETVISALGKHGIEIPISCEQGVCGTCVTRILDGIPEHRDMYFSDEEKARNDQFTPCCSRCVGDSLFLDL